MRITFLILLLIAGIVLIASVLLQSGSSAGLSGSIAGGAEQLFGKKKSKGYDAILSKVTVCAAALFIIAAVVLYAME